MKPDLKRVKKAFVYRITYNAKHKTVLYLCNTYDIINS